MTQMMKSFHRWFRSSLRLQILTFIGILISFLIIVISIGILLQWRTLTINQHKDSAKSFSRAFSITVIEVLINVESQNGDIFLETRIQNFLDNVDGIHYISIQDRNNRILAHSDLSRYGSFITDPKFVEISNSPEVITSIFEDDEYGWVLETLQPLQIGNRKWGTVLIGFDASHLTEKISNSFRLILFVTLIAIIITLSLLYYFINSVTLSLRELVEEVDKFDLITGTGLDMEPRNDEIGILIDHFSMLKKRLSDSKVELENAQRQIYQAEKLASIGRLAAGVAHEVNNPLNGMRFCVYSIQQDPDNQSQMLEYLSLINEGLSQIESVVSKLLGYSKQNPKSTNPVDFVKQAQVVVDLLDYRIKKKYVTVTITQDNELPIIYADKNLIQEMLMNLILNSLDAVDENGEIAISFTKERNNLCIKVRDNGVGIMQKELEKIFDPFFSTKETGQGTGLGLYVTLGIVEAYNGTITVKSEPKVYTEFTITLSADKKE